MAGLLSISPRSSIVPGRFPRSLGDSVYFHRRLYGLCWTSIYYFTPIYFVVLSIPFLKRMTFWLFGYIGKSDFTTYPDTWIRDIPLLKLGKGVYLSNRATIGTNIAFPNGTIMVEQVTIGDDSLIGHLSMIAPGVTIGKRVEIGVGVAIGLRTVIGDDVRINPCCAIEHGVTIGSGAKIGSMTYIGSSVQIAPGLTIPPGISIPQKSIIRDQADVAFFGQCLSNARANRKLRPLVV